MHPFWMHVTGMKLADFLSSRQMRDAEFALRIGVTRQTLWRYKSGERRPEWDVLDRIRLETEGEVTPNDFLEAPRILKSEAAAVA